MWYAPRMSNDSGSTPGTQGAFIGAGAGTVLGYAAAKLAGSNGPIGALAGLVAGGIIGWWVSVEHDVAAMNSAGQQTMAQDESQQSAG